MRGKRVRGGRERMTLSDAWQKKERERERCQNGDDGRESKRKKSVIEAKKKKKNSPFQQTGHGICRAVPTGGFRHRAFRRCDYYSTSSWALFSMSRVSFFLFSFVVVSFFGVLGQRREAATAADDDSLSLFRVCRSLSLSRVFFIRSTRGGSGASVLLARRTRGFSAKRREKGVALKEARKVVWTAIWRLKEGRRAERKCL